MKIKIRFASLLTATLAFLILWQIFNDDLFLVLLVLFSLVIFISYLSARLSLQGIIIQRSSRYQKMNVGNYFEDHFDIENKYPFWKQWLEIHDHSGISGNAEEVRVLTGLEARKVRTFNTYTFLNKRGVYSLGPLQLVSGDALDCFEFTRQVDIPGRLVVLPRIIELDRFAHLPAYLSGGKELKVASAETTPFAAGVREYYPGDPLRRIHWPTTARKQKLMVKEFDRDPQMNTWLFLDCQTQAHFEHRTHDRASHPSDYWSVRQQAQYSLPCSTFEYAVTVAASLTRYFLLHNFGVGIVSSNSQEQLLVSDHGFRQLGRALDMLAYIQPDGNLPFSHFVGEYHKYLNSGSTVIYVSTQLTQDTLAMLDFSSARGLHPIYILINRPSFEKETATKDTIPPLQAELLVRHIPLYVINYRTDIKECLENGEVPIPQGIPA
jgi:uncharacterized protein (DUF58 family)